MSPIVLLMRGTMARTAPSRRQTVRVDKDGRLVIPEQMRQEWNIHAGDVFVVKAGRRGLRYARPVNPIDGLARQAISEYREGKTRSLRNIMRDEGVAQNDE
jgi:bifunctional DNA-binding transcriptional regulator/antitoxin component of YhaV-PrlF toxin-antitoxin module